MSKLFLSWTKKEKLKIWCHCASVELTVRRRWDLVTNSQILCWCLCRESRNSKSDRSATVYQHVLPLALPTQEEKEKEELRRAQARLGEYLCNTCVCVCACSRFFPRLTVSRLCYTNFRRATVHGRQKGFWILWLICWSLGHDCGVWRMIEVLAAKSYPSRVPWTKTKLQGWPIILALQEEEEQEIWSQNYNATKIQVGNEFESSSIFNQAIYAGNAN